MRHGRRAEFARFPEFRDPELRERIPDPQAAETFAASKLKWDEVDEVDHRDWLEWHQRPFVVVATKADKLKSQKERHLSMEALRKGYSGGVLECSAVTGRGVREIWQAISKIKNNQ